MYIKTSHDKAVGAASVIERITSLAPHMQLGEAKQEQAPIKVTLPDGSEKPGVRLVTTPMDIAKAISKSLANNAVVAKVDGKEWDLLRPLESDCKLSLHTFADREGKEVRIDFAVVVLGNAPFP